MRIIFSEFAADYDKYRFPYQVYGIIEKGDSIDSIYEMGLLPTRINKNLFNLCRSTRILLRDLELTSENRRVARKTEYLEAELIELSDFEYNYEIGKMAKDFSKDRFKDHILSPQATKRLFTDSSMTHVMQFKDRTTDKIIGYCLLLLGGQSFHYSYPFYDMSYFQKNIGMGMIIKAVEMAKQEEFDYFYLGTCYTKDSLYKLQFNNMEYYTGFGWSDNIDQLKKLVNEPQGDHLFKLVKDKESFVKMFQDE